DLKDGSLVLAFEKQGVGRPTYSAHPPTKAESKAYHVCWAAESKRLFEIVNDPGYQRNMKEGRPHHYIPSSSTL
ncbi:hypothetical protein AGABI2DRAFT_55200, partial [Agaricus bisporus var. bisporus H97]|uniref:hypothetical protein n=1 Tax=Agaricus bisporus var. bisporus (strain H97 / ATCC MYA-4626 / FGSC 10389) TaxID=936046 RepID=UPI00029F76A7